MAWCQWVVVPLALMGAGCGDSKKHNHNGNDGGMDSSVDAHMDMDSDVPNCDSSGWTQDIQKTDLDLNVGTLDGVAIITVAASCAEQEITLEVGSLAIDSVKDAEGNALAYDTVAAAGDGEPNPPIPNVPRIVVTIPATDAATFDIVITYGFQGLATADWFDNDNFVLLSGGWSSEDKFTWLWPYYCSNLFPCDSHTADGTKFAATVSGASDGDTTIVPPTIDFDGPSYMFGFVIGTYTKLSVGTTAGGVNVSVYHGDADGEAQLAADGTAHLVDYLEFYETTLGAYAYGDEVAPVMANIPYYGLEQHPNWLVWNAASLEELDQTFAHEAAHGWFGDGVRMACWEDLVMSEGLATYLAGKAVGAVQGSEAEDAYWTKWQGNLDYDAAGDWDGPALPDGCNEIDIPNSYLWAGVIPYTKGAFFFKAVEDAVGEEDLLNALSAFYAANKGKAVRTQDLIDFIATETNTDLTTLTTGWLKSNDYPGYNP